jgi:hypothetical protein
LEYHVEITETALDDAEEYVQFIRKVNKEPEAAEKWFRGRVQNENRLVTIYRIYHGARSGLSHSFTASE